MEGAVKEPYINLESEIGVKSDGRGAETPKSKALAAAMAAEMIQELKKGGKVDGTRAASVGNQFNEFCSHLGLGRVCCKLCGKTYKVSGFRHHMRSVHLPDETCARCGGNFRPRQLYRHTPCTGPARSRTEAEECRRCGRRVEACHLGRHLRTCRGLQARAGHQLPGAREGEELEARARPAPTQAIIKEGRAASEVSRETSVMEESSVMEKTTVMEETSVESLHLVDSSDDD